MLSELRIDDFAIIDRLRLTFSDGLVIFTGETGAGKSIIIDAVDLLMGGRADEFFHHPVQRVGGLDHFAKHQLGMIGVGRFG